MLAGFRPLALAVVLVPLIAGGASAAAPAVERSVVERSAAVGDGKARRDRSAALPSFMIAQAFGDEDARRERPGFSPYRAGVYAGAAEAGAIIGADAVDDALASPPPPDPACNFPSQPIGSLSAGIPPCNYCDNPPCN